MAEAGDTARDAALEPTIASSEDAAPDSDALGATLAAGSAPGDPGGDGGEVLAEATPERYQLADEIGRGGLGKVVRAKDRHLGRQVAIKALHAEGSSARRRFVREALITARLEHPSIVPVHDAGRWPDGSPFYAMKLVRGRPLAAVIDESRDLTARLALVPTVLAVADAVAYAHSERVVHRDLKPHNVLVGEFGETVVIDWGLAKDLGAADEHEAASALTSPSASTSGSGSRSGSGSGSRSTETVAGSVLGTPAYMAPEQALGENVDERADVYALGALLYHVLVGKPPHDGGSIEEVLDRAVTGAVVPLATREPGVPRDLAAIVGKAMARKPDDRYPSARELAEDLRRFLTGQLVGAHRYTWTQRTRRWLRRNRGVAITVAAAVAAVAVIGTISLRDVLRSRDSADRQRDVAVAASTRADHERAAAEDAGNRAVLAQARAALERDPAEALAWLAKLSVDGPGWDAARAITADALWRGPPDRVLRGHRGTPRGLAAADASRAVSWDDGAVWLWDLAAGTGTPFAVTRTHEALVCGDGTRILGQGVRPDGAISDFTIELPRGQVVFGKVSVAERTRCGEPPTPEPDDCDFVASTPDGQTIACGDPSVSVRHGLGGKPRVLRKAPARLLAIDDDGRWIAVDHDTKIDVYDLARGTVRWSIPTGATRQLAFGPGGHELLVVAERGQIWDLDHGGGRRFGDDSVLAAVYLPDGRIATIGTDRALRLWSLRAQPPKQDGELTAAAFGADGTSLVVGTKDGALRRIDGDRVVASVTLPGVPAATAAVKGVAIAGDGAVAAVVAGGDVWTWRPGSAPAKLGAHAEARVTTGEPNEIAWLGTDVVSWNGATVRIFSSAAPMREIELPPLPPPPALTDTPGDILVMPGCAAPAGAAATLVIAPGARVLAITRNTMNGCDQLTYLVDVAAGTAQLLGGSAGHRAAFTPDGRSLVTSAPDGAILIWDVATRTPRRIDAHVPHPHGAAVSADGHRVAVSGEGAVALAELGAAPARTLEIPDPNLLGAWFDDAGRTVVIATDDGAWIWDLASGERRGLSVGLPLAIHAGADQLDVVADGRIWRIRDDLPRTPAALARRLAALGYSVPAAAP